MKATDAQKGDEQEKMITQGLKLQLETVRRKALRSARRLVKVYFQLLARGVGPSQILSRDTGTRPQPDWLIDEN